MKAIVAGAVAVAVLSFIDSQFFSGRYMAAGHVVSGKVVSAILR